MNHIKDGIPISAKWNRVTNDSWEELKKRTIFAMVCWEYTAPVFLVTNQSHAVVEGVKIGHNHDGITVVESFGMEHDYVQQYFIPKKNAYLTRDINKAVNSMLVRAEEKGRLEPSFDQTK